jgi:hypothetical protein
VRGGLLNRHGQLLAERDGVRWLQGHRFWLCEWDCLLLYLWLKMLAHWFLLLLFWLSE